MKLTVQEKQNPKTGKPLTVISGLKHNPQVIEILAGKLKRACGAGGHIEAKSIYIQGSHKKKIMPILEKDGFEVV